MPPENILTPADKNLRRIRPTTFKVCDYNTIARHEIHNTRGFKIPGSKTEQYKSSFFVRAVADWNKLDDNVVTADCHCNFISGRQSATRSRDCLPHIGSQIKGVLVSF